MKDQDVRICFVGDSFVQGTCDPDCLGWPARVCRAAIKLGVGVTCYNLGVRRDTSADILQRWPAECERRLPPGCEAYVVFSFGNNGTTAECGVTRVDETYSLRNAETILRAARGERYRTAIVGPPPMLEREQNERTARLSEAFESIAFSLGIPYLPMFDRLLADPVWREELEQSDGSHPG